MEGNFSVSFSRCFLFGVGVGTGIAFTVYITNRFFRHQPRQELVLALKEVSSEISQLRGAMVAQNFGGTLLGRKKTGLQRRGGSEQKLVDVGGGSLVDFVLQSDEQQSSSDEDNFYDLVSYEDDDLDDSFPNISKIIEECDELSDQTSEINIEKEVELLEELFALDQDNVDVLWRLARVNKKKANLVQDDDQNLRMEFLQKGIEYSEMAVKLDENNGDVHKWYAVLLGSRALYEGLTQRLATGSQYKRHIMDAVKLKPRDPTVKHLVGRLAYEFASLPWWQQSAASAILGELPGTTMEDALVNFDEAEKLSPGFLKTNLLFIGKCYQQLGDLDQAGEWLRKSLELPENDDEDRTAAEEARTILQNLR